MNWPVKKLGEVATLKRGPFGGSLKKEIFVLSGYKVYEQKNAINNDFNLGNYFIDEEKYKEMELFRVMPGDLIVSCSGTMGKVAIAPENIKPGIINQALLRLTPSNKILAVYLKFILETPKIQQIAFSSTQGSAIKNVSGVKVLKDIEIPVPSIEKQKRIVKKLEKILAKIEEASTFRQELSEEVQNIIRARLGELFDNNSWDETRVSDIAEKPQYGYTASSTQDKIGPRLLRITDIQNGMVDWGKVPYCKCNEIDKYKLTAGDIVFARTGATTGKSFLIKDTPEQTVFASYLIRLKTRSGIKQEFLYWFFQSPQYWNQIMGHQRGSAQPNVNAVTLSTIKLRMPENLKEQGKIVAYLDGLSEKVQALQKLQQGQLQDLEALQQSVLHQAFQGGL